MKYIFSFGLRFTKFGKEFDDAHAYKLYFHEFMAP
jgi:hypothetical protein